MFGSRYETSFKVRLVDLITLTELKMYNNIRVGVSSKVDSLTYNLYIG